ncbi:unnamed protein product [Lupinus luteus]|uniref:Uncharacterized protein n=1 Tax=Lupinus luteus TaxID=3873 RepID=A0AAV1WFK6_LUPLU
MLSKPIHLSETEESGISCVGVKSADLRRKAKSEGSSLGPYQRWSAKAWGANGIRYPGDDDVELAAEKDSAFRRAARWCGCKAERIRKDCPSSDCSLQLGNMKLESLVIADQHAAVNMYPGPVHTARHTLGIGFARSTGPMITHDFCVPLVPQRLLVVFLAHTTVGSSTGVKS